MQDSQPIERLRHSIFTAGALKTSARPASLLCIVGGKPRLSYIRTRPSGIVKRKHPALAPAPGIF